MSLILGSTPAATAAVERDDPIRVIDDGLDDLVIVTFSTGGPYALLSDGAGFFHANLETGSVNPIDFGVGYSTPKVFDPTYAYAVREDGRFTGENVVARQHRETGVVEQLEPQLATFQSVEAVGSSADGRFLLLLAGDSMGSLSSQKYLLYDAQSNAVLSSEQTGLDPDGHFVTAAQISSDGTTVLYTRRLSSGLRQQVRWDRAADVRRVADAPHPTNDFSISTNLEWAIWPEETIIGGQPQIPLKRKNLVTGEVVTVDNDDPFYNNYANFVLDDGRVVYVTDDDVDPQLYLWTGPGVDPIRLTVSPDGEPANDGINFFLSNLVVFADGSRAFFTSYATNLAEGTPTARKRIYEIALTPGGASLMIDAPIPAAPLQVAERLGINS